MVKAPPTPKGFRDIQPEMAKKRRQVISKISDVLEEYGFLPIETPTLEFAETLKGKYGEEERLIYQFKDRGGRELALRYDLTIPLARYVATYNPKLPFKRYQVGQVFRGENPQKGRWREFTQFDFDTVSPSSPEVDAEILILVYKIYKALGLDVVIKINDRQMLTKYEVKILGSIDKLNKVGEEGVIDELTAKGLSQTEAKALLEEVKSIKISDNLAEIKSIFNEKVDSDESLDFDPTMVRGLDYYTGLIIEVVLKSDLNSPSLGGGGRYDNLIGLFAKQTIPAVGFSFGIDRIVEVLSN